LLNGMLFMPALLACLEPVMKICYKTQMPDETHEKTNQQDAVVLPNLMLNKSSSDKNAKAGEPNVDIMNVKFDIIEV